MTTSPSKIRYICLPEKEVSELLGPEFAQSFEQVLQSSTAICQRFPRTVGLENTIQVFLDLEKEFDGTTVFLSPACYPLQRQAVHLLSAFSFLKGWKQARWNPTQKLLKEPTPIDFFTPKKQKENPRLFPEQGLTRPSQRIGLRWLTKKEMETKEFGKIAEMRKKVDALWILHNVDSIARETAKEIQEKFKDTTLIEVKTSNLETLESDAEKTLFEKVWYALRTCSENDALTTYRYEFLIDLTTGREVNKSILINLSLQGHLPGKWILGDGDGVEIDPLELKILIEEQQARIDEELDAKLQTVSDATHNVALQKIRRSILTSAKDPRKLPILLCGPTGSGKSHMVKSIAKLNKIPESRFIHLNCSEFSGDTNILLSRLFGCEQGAHSMALENQSGAFEEAHEGILFLDEIGEMPLAAQAKLLVVLDRTPKGFVFSPLGSTRRITSDCLLVCGTNRNLKNRIEEGRFREDLYHRIAYREYHIPSLFERLHGIPSLSQRREEALHMLEHIWKPASIPFIDSATLGLLADIMLNHEWKGNYREFQVWSHSLLDQVKFGRLTTPAVLASQSVLLSKDQPGTGVPLPADLSTPSLEEISQALTLAGDNNAKLYQLAVDKGWINPVKNGASVIGGRLRQKYLAQLTK